MFVLLSVDCHLADVASGQGKKKFCTYLQQLCIRKLVFPSFWGVERIFFRVETPGDASLSQG